MDFTLFLGILAFFVAISVSISIHEFGHLLFAKKFGIPAKEFGIGWPPPFFNLKLNLSYKGQPRVIRIGVPPQIKLGQWGETNFVLNFLPLGGYVQMGENDQNGDQLMRHLPGAKRVAILIAGVSANFLLAWLLFFINAAFVNHAGILPALLNSLLTCLVGMVLTVIAIPMAFADPSTVGGIFSIGQTYVGATSATVSLGSITPILLLTGLLNLSLAGFNLLPLPVLDGGRILFLALEKFTRGKSVRFEGVLTALSVLVLFTLVIVLAVKDLTTPVPTIDWNQLLKPK